MSLLSASLLFCSVSFAEEPSSQTDSDESKVSVEEPESDSKSKTPSSIVESFEGSAVLLNGDRLTGMIYVYSDERVVIQLNNKVSVQLTKSVIKKLIPKVGKYNIEDKGTTRYFYTPTAMPLNELS